MSTGDKSSRASLVVGISIRRSRPKPRFYYGKRASSTAGTANCTDSDFERRHTQLLGPKSDGQEGPDTGSGIEADIPARKAGRLQRTMRGVLRVSTCADGFPRACRVRRRFFGLV